MKICYAIFMITGIGLLTGCDNYHPATDTPEGNGKSDATYTQLSNGFKTPPATARPNVYHWWLGGNVDTVRLKEELQSFKDAGISGFTIFEIGSRDKVNVRQGPAFLSEKSLASIKVAVEQAGKLGLTVGLNTASSWNAGGAWITPVYAAKSIYQSTIKITDTSPDKIKVPFPAIPEKDPWGKRRMIQYRKDGKPMYYEEIAVLALPVASESSMLDTARIVNVSRYFDSETETLNWKAPKGEWEIQRYVCSNSGENLVLPSEHSAGPILDHYDAKATEFHFNYVIEKLESVLGDLRQTALKSLYMASYEMKGFTWTPTLPGEFKRINGHTIDKLLPALFAEKIFAPEVHAEFRADFQRTLSDLMINNFYRKSREICNEHGLKNNSEAGGPGLPLHNVPVEPIKALGNLDIPRGEFWINHSRFNENGVDILRVVKEISSASNIYNRNIVELEAFTSFQHWREGPFEMKPSGDRAFAEGMNKVVVHGSTHNPQGTGFPGIVYHAGTHYNDKRVWWSKVKPFNEYLARVSYILQEADFVADVLYYYGDTIPNYGGHKNSRFVAGPGYDYEIVNTEILREATVEGNRIVLPRNNAAFRVLALSGEQRMHPDILSKVQEFASKGISIVGARPDLAHDVSPAGMLASLKIGPDFHYHGDDLFTLDYTHYAKDGLDFYFIRNTTDQWISKACSFRQINKIPELWNPVNGEIAPVTVYSSADGNISMPLTLPPYGSTFVVFRAGSAEPRYTQITAGTKVPQLSYSKDGVFVWDAGRINLVSNDQQKEVDNFIAVGKVGGAWEVYFPKDWGAPERTIFNELVSWTESEVEGIKYFSGTATYKKTFQHGVNADARTGTRAYLDLGDLSHVGEAWLNDQPLGITWAKPHRFDVTDVLKPGENTLVVEIANTWNNRLVGDAVTPGKDFTRTNITSTDVFGLNHTQVSWKDVPLINSGLFGPVRILTLKPIE